MRRIIDKYIILAALLSLVSCAGKPTNVNPLADEAPIFPDYKEVTVPENIAPLNFSFLGEGKTVLLAGDKVIKSCHGVFKFGGRKWRKLVSEGKESGKVQFSLSVKKDGKWLSYNPFYIYVRWEYIRGILSHIQKRPSSRTT